MDNNPSEILGKKIFFLHPTALILNQIIAELVQQEFEVYAAKDHTALERVLKRYPDSIIFVDIDEHMAEPRWEEWIRKIMVVPELKGIDVGVISTTDDEPLKRKYINSVQVSCGYTVLKSDPSRAIMQIMDILKAVDAKGRRKYIRATTENETMTTVNIPLNGNFVTGTIKDISVVGISCTFDNDPGLAKNTLFKDIQVKLQSMLLKVEGIVFGSRMDGNAKIYVILFTQRIDPEVRTKTRKYIQQNLQNKMDIELK